MRINFLACLHTLESFNHGGNTDVKIRLMAVFAMSQSLRLKEEHLRHERNLPRTSIIITVDRASIGGSDKDESVCPSVPDAL